MFVGGKLTYSVFLCNILLLLLLLLLLLRTHNQCGDTIEKSQAPDDGFINVRNILSIEE